MGIPVLWVLFCALHPPGAQGMWWVPSAPPEKPPPGSCRPDPRHHPSSLPPAKPAKRFCWNEAWLYWALIRLKGICPISYHSFSGCICSVFISLWGLPWQSSQTRGLKTRHPPVSQPGGGESCWQGPTPLKAPGRILPHLFQLPAWLARRGVPWPEDGDPVPASIITSTSVSLLSLAFVPWPEDGDPVPASITSRVSVSLLLSVWRHQSHRIGAHPEDLTFLFASAESVFPHRVPFPDLLQLSSRGLKSTCDCIGTFTFTIKKTLWEIFFQRKCIKLWLSLEYIME